MQNYQKKKKKSRNDYVGGSLSFVAPLLRRDNSAVGKQFISLCLSTIKNSIYIHYVNIFYRATHEKVCMKMSSLTTKNYESYETQKENLIFYVKRVL